MRSSTVETILERVASSGEVIDLLAEIASRCHSDGCVLWIPTGNGSSERRLFAAGQWLREGEQPPFHYCGETSTIYRQALAREPINLADPGEAENAFTQLAIAPLLSPIQACCIIPVIVEEAVGATSGTIAGAVTLVRCWPEPFSSDEFDLAKRLAPLAVQWLRDRQNGAAAELFQAVASGLPARPPKPGSSREYHAWQKTALDQVMGLMEKHLHCVEASVYLSPDRSGSQVKLYGKRWPWPNEQKQSYDAGVGLTGYCLAKQVPVSIFDLETYDADADWMRTSHPGMSWTRSATATQQVPRLKPLGFEAVPIMDGSKPVGVLRCSLSRSGYCFLGLQGILAFIAGQIGQWFGYSMHLQQDGETWLKNYVHGMVQLNKKVHLLALGRPLEHLELIQQALKTVTETVPNAHSYCVRLADHACTQLQFVAHYPELRTYPAQIAKQIRALSLPLGDHPVVTSVAADAFRKNEPRWIPDLAKSPRYTKIIFPETNALLVAPISSADRRYGTIEVRFTEADDMPEQGKLVMQLLGQHLGMSLALTDKVKHVEGLKRTLEETIETQENALELIAHQLKREIGFARTKLIYRFDYHKPVPEHELDAVRGLLRRAEEVSSAVKNFVDIERGQPIEISSVAATKNAILTRLETAAREFTTLYRRKNMQYHIKSDSFAVLDNNQVYLDMNLFEQIVDNLLDNAGKYGTARSKVNVCGGLTHADRVFFVSVSNQGLRVRPETAQNLAQRGQRANKALFSREEGSGLGLYIVNHFMHAQNGRLEIIPTDNRGIVDFRLHFPVVKQGS